MVENSITELVEGIGRYYEGMPKVESLQALQLRKNIRQMQVESDQHMLGVYADACYVVANQIKLKTMGNHIWQSYQNLSNMCFELYQRLNQQKERVD